MTPWMAWIGSPSLAAWDWHPFSGTRSSACLTMWQGISVLASKETTHYFLGSFFAGLAGWVSSSCAQIYGGGGKSQGAENKALASGGGAAGLVHQPFCLYTLKGMSVFPKNWGDTWFLWTSLTRAWKWAGKWTVWTPGGIVGEAVMSSYITPDVYLLDAAHCVLSNGHSLQREVHKMKPCCFVCRRAAV